MAKSAFNQLKDFANEMMWDFETEDFLPKYGDLATRYEAKDLKKGLDYHFDNLIVDYTVKTHEIEDYEPDGTHIGYNSEVKTVVIDEIKIDDVVISNQSVVLAFTKQIKTAYEQATISYY